MVGSRLEREGKNKRKVVVVVDYFSSLCLNPHKPLPSVCLLTPMIIINYYSVRIVIRLLLLLLLHSGCFAIAFMTVSLHVHC